MARCSVCFKESAFVSSALGVCGPCLMQGKQAERVEALRASVRRGFELPERIPREAGEAACGNCSNRCSPAEGESGFCGVWQRAGGAVVPRFDFRREALFSFYHDPLPTNCVADWVCPGGTGAGYPEYAVRDGPERGFFNLAVFFEACNFDCLFCQNWHFRKQARRGRPVPLERLVGAVNERTTCICYFGGDPTVQMEAALHASEAALRAAAGRVLRICWETNGGAAAPLLDRAFELSLRTGGCVKFDLKAWNESLHRALTGTSAEPTRRNFARLAKRFEERPEPPPLVASTLLVPGYITAEEVREIAGFIAELDPRIPYALLAFAPQYCMDDLPPTPRAFAQEALKAARESGLTRVRLGNQHLLW